MKRVRSVPKGTRAPVDKPRTDQKTKNPPAATDGLPEIEVRNPEPIVPFDKAICELIQARWAVRYAIEAATNVKKAGGGDPFRGDPRGEYLETYLRAWRVYEKCYATTVRDAFKEFIGHEFSDFEAALEWLGETLHDTSKDRRPFFGMITPEVVGQ